MTRQRMMEDMHLAGLSEASQKRHAMGPTHMS